MLKFMLWPFVVAAIGLVVVAIISIKGNGVVDGTRKLPPPSSPPKYWWWIIALIVFDSGLAGLLYYFNDTSAAPLIRLLVLATHLIVGFAIMLGMLWHAAIDIFFGLAPTAAKVGENLTNDQRRQIVRHGMRWFTKFKNW